MASGGAAAAAATAIGGSPLFVTNSGSINFCQKHLFPFKIPNLYSQFCSRSITAEIIRNSQGDSNAEADWSKKFKFKFRDKNKQYRDNDAVDEDEEEYSGGPGMGKKRRWWSDKPPDIEEDEEASILEEFLDSLWILKLSKFYGWALPPMIISSLIATGPKAFLLTLSLTIGQSILSFVFQKLTGRKRSKPRRKVRKRRRKPFVSYPGSVGTDDREESRPEETLEGNGLPRTWVVNNDDSVKKDKQDAQSFGGWDELDGVENIGRRPPAPPRREADQNRRKKWTNGKLGKRRGESNGPLLLRLLIAVFPFLASWTKLL